jgi:hypothetical protein
VTLDGGLKSMDALHGAKELFGVGHVSSMKKDAPARFALHPYI